MNEPGASAVRRVLILSGIQLSTNPRVVKEAATLADAGYDVEVLSAVFDEGLLERDRALLNGARWKNTILVDSSSSSWIDRLRWFASRLQTRVWREMQTRLGVSHPAYFGYVSGRMLRSASDDPADLVILHMPQALWVGARLLDQNRAIAVDMEDWHSEEVGEDPTFPKEKLREWESLVLRGARYSTTTSRSLSNALRDQYHCPEPAVIYNSFPLSDRETIDNEFRDRVDRSLPSLCWFSQVVGPGRGLELLFEALQMTRTALEIHLRGKCTAEFRSALLDRLPEQCRRRIFFHEQVPENELISRLAEHDAGLACELPIPRNRDLTVTNKILQYLLAGIPVVASDTEGQREVAELAAGAVLLYSANSAAHLASTIDWLFGDPGLLHPARKQAALAAEQVFCWERSSLVLVEQVQRAIGKPSSKQ